MNSEKCKARYFEHVFLPSESFWSRVCSIFKVIQLKTMSWKLGSFCFKLVFPQLLLLKSPHFNTLSKTLLLQIVSEASPTQRNLTRQSCICATSAKRNKSPQKSFGFRNFPRSVMYFTQGAFMERMPGRRVRLVAVSSSGLVCEVCSHS